MNRAKRVIEGCKFKNGTDISGSKAQRYIAYLRKGDVNICAQTYNFHLQSIKQFCGWMVQDRRVNENPVFHLKGLNVKTDRWRVRRALTVDEIRNPIETTKDGPKRYGMTGPERAMLYRVAVETGLRAGELRSLKVSSFDLNICTVTVEAAYSKRGDLDTIPLKPDTAKAFQDFFRGKFPFSTEFNNMPERTSDMFQEDLADAGIPYIDESGRYADFHGLRHTAGSLLAASGVHPKVAQTIMRHSTVDLTLNRYSHVYRGQETEAVNNLPDLSLPSSKQKAKRQPPPVRRGRKNLASCLALSCRKQQISADNNGQNQEKTNSNKNGLKTTLEAKISGFSAKNLNGGGGIRTPGTRRYSGFQDRRLKPLGHSSNGFPSPR